MNSGDDHHGFYPFDDPRNYNNAFYDQRNYNNGDINFDYQAQFSSFHGQSSYNPGAFAVAPELHCSQTLPEEQEFPVLDIEAATSNNKSNIGLKLTKTASFLRSLNQLTNYQVLKQQQEDSITSQTDDDVLPNPDKFKAASFSALSLQIGSWKKEAKHESQLVAKCYFKKRKLVWEALDGNLKTKLEFQWSDISAINATYKNGLGILDIMLEKSPLFFREVNPQPRKHTNWEQSDDFTDNQASLIRRHRLEFGPGVLEKHYDKILQADPKLRRLSQQPFPYQANQLFREIHFANNELSFNNNNNNIPPIIPHQLQQPFSSNFGTTQHQHQQQPMQVRFIPIKDTISPMSVMDFPGQNTYPNQLIASGNYQSVAMNPLLHQGRPGPGHYYRDGQSQFAMSPPADLELGYDQFPAMNNPMLQHIPCVLPQDNTVGLHQSQAVGGLPVPYVTPHQSTHDHDHNPNHNHHHYQPNQDYQFDGNQWF